MSWQDTKIEWYFRIPLPMLSSLFHAFKITDLRNYWEKDIVFSNGKVVYHTNNRSDQPDDLGDLPVSIDSVVADIRGSVAFGFIAEAVQLSRLGVQFGMSSERQGWYLTIEIFQI